MKPKHNASAETRLPVRRAALALVLALGAAPLASACSGRFEESRLLQQSEFETLSPTTIIAPSNFRESPGVHEDSSTGESNWCAQTVTPVDIPQADVLIHPGDANGKFIGFDVNLMPEKIRNDCTDGDGMVWVVEDNLNAPLSSLILSAPAE